MIKEQNIKAEQAIGLKNKDKREIKFQGKTAMFQYIECSFEEANLLFSLIQNVAFKNYEENLKSNINSSNEYLGLQIITGLKCTKEGQEALKNCLKRCLLNDLIYENAIKITENWGFTTSCEMLVIDEIIRIFQDF